LFCLLASLVRLYSSVSVSEAAGVALGAGHDTFRTGRRRRRRRRTTTKSAAYDISVAPSRKTTHRIAAPE
jgi:hypothetical protein